jgi:hypothetical protein
MYGVHWEVICDYDGESRCGHAVALSDKVEATKVSLVLNMISSYAKAAWPRVYCSLLAAQLRDATILRLLFSYTRLDKRGSTKQIQ